ncbi:GGDEF domain-containing protein [Kineococcus sp. LSe6-4]|uniref:GGDEF domain-containing protein n=1 Tax=Kineococcus halophytocola TaxID=3234027 RepID=A0ABV4GVR2_9ACTN
MTRLLNRRGLRLEFERLVRSGTTGPNHLGVVLLDLDHFKAVNDTHGHAVGDAALVAVSEVMRRTAREGDVLARIGGEELIWCSTWADPAQALTAASALRRRLEVEIQEVVGFLVTASLGVALVPAAECGPSDGAGHLLETLTSEADKAVYLSTSAGRNTTSVRVLDRAAVRADAADGG